MWTCPLYSNKQHHRCYYRNVSKYLKRYIIMKKIYLIISLGLATIGAQAQTALHFDAINDHVEIDTVMDYIYDFTGDFTIEAWINAETGGLWPSVVTKFDNVAGARYGYWFGINGSGTVGMQIFDGTAGAWPNVSGTTFLQDNNWHHIAGVMDSDTMKVYVDGILEGTLLTTFTPVYNNHALWFGNDAENDIFHGTIDDVRAWNIARTPAEITNYKDSCLDGSQSNLVGLWHFEEGNGSQVTDYTVNNHFGTLVNMDTVTSWTAGINCSVCNFTSITGTDIQTACDSYTWIDGNTYTSSVNTPTFTLTNAAGCDSIVTLNLTINISNTGTDIQTACDSYTWIDGVTYNASNNTATHTLTNASGCDSVVSLNLTISSIVTTISQNGNDIEATATNGTAPYSYDWNTGETTASIIPADNGMYWVMVSDADSCFADTATFDVTFVSGTGIDNWNNSVSVYPNPTSDILTISTGNYTGALKVNVYDLFGRKVFTSNDKEISLKSFADGVYILEFKAADNTYTTRIIKE